MKALIAKLSVIALTSLAPAAALHAQTTQSIVYGRATIVLTPAVLQQLAAVGATLTDLTPTNLQNGTNVLPALQGAIDLTTAANEVEYAGGYLIKVGAHTLRLQSFTLDLVGPSAVFSAIVIENGVFIGREAIFSIVASGAPTLPIVPVNDTISHNGLNLSFEQPFITLFNNVAGNSGLTTSTTIGTLNLYSVLAPLSTTSPYPVPYPPSSHPTGPFGW